MSHYLIRLGVTAPPTRQHPDFKRPFDFGHHPREWWWFVVTDDPERTTHVAKEALTNGCHPNAEFTRGCAIALRSLGLDAFPAHVTKGLHPVHKWLTGYKVPAIHLPRIVELHRGFVNRHITCEHRAEGTEQEMHAALERIVWFTPRKRVSGVPVVCNAMCHDDTAPAGHPDPVHTFGEATMDWVARHPRVTVLPDLIAADEEEARQQGDAIREQAAQDYADAVKDALTNPPPRSPFTWVTELVRG